MGRQWKKNIPACAHSQCINQRISNAIPADPDQDGWLGKAKKNTPPQYSHRVNNFPVQVGATLVEAANFEVPGFATGCYMVAACGGRVLWEEAAPDSWGFLEMFEISNNKLKRVFKWTISALLNFKNKIENA